MTNVARAVLLLVVLALGLIPINAWTFAASASVSYEQRELDRLYAAYWKDWSALEARSNEALGDSWDHDATAMLRHLLAQKLSYYGTGVYVTARMLAVNQFTGHHMEFALDQSGSGDYNFKTVADYDHALKLADGYARWTDDAIARMQEGVSKGVVLPRIVVERVLQQLQQYFGSAPEKTVFWQPIMKFPAGIPVADRQRLTKAYAAKIADVIEPAYRKLHSYMHDEYLPHASAKPGLGALPGGAALYAYDIRANTTTEMTPAQIHQLGLAQVREITGELQDVLKTVGFHGSLEEFLAHVRSDKTLHFENPDEVVPAYDAA